MPKGQIRNPHPAIRNQQAVALVCRIGQRAA